MPCVVDITQGDLSNHFEILLCKACKFLTVEQIKLLVNHGSGIQSGMDWYANHLWLDCKHNDDDILSFSDGTREKEIALRELFRIGYEIKYFDNGSEQLISIGSYKKDYPY